MQGAVPTHTEDKLLPGYAELCGAWAAVQLPVRALPLAVSTSHNQGSALRAAGLSCAVCEHGYARRGAVALGARDSTRRLGYRQFGIGEGGRRGAGGGWRCVGTLANHPWPISQRSGKIRVRYMISS